MSVNGRVIVNRRASGVEIVPDGWTHSASPAACGYVSVLGGGLLIPIQGGPGLPYVSLQDPYEGLWWVSAAFGEDVADALRSVLDDSEMAFDPAAGKTATADAELTPFGVATCRTAVGAWLHRWWPSANAVVKKLDIPLLEIELGLNAWQAEVCLGETLLADSVLSRNVGRLTALFGAVDWAIPEDQLGRRERILSLAARATLETCDPDLEGMRELRELYDAAIKSQWSATIATWEESAPPEAAEERVLALAAGGGSAPRHTTTTDWALLSPRSVTPYDDNVEWEFSGSGEAVTATVRVHVGEAPRASLWARVLDAGHTPIAQFELPRAGRVYEGTSGPLGATAEAAGIEIFDPLFDRGPGGASLDSAADLRDYVRKVAEGRQELARRPIRQTDSHTPFLAEIATSADQS